MNGCDFLKACVVSSLVISKKLISDFPDIFEASDKFALERYLASYFRSQYKQYTYVLNYNDYDDIYLRLISSKTKSNQIRELLSHNRFIRVCYKKFQNFRSLKKIYIPKNLTLIFVHEKKYLTYILNTDLKLNNIVVCLLGNDKELYKYAKANFHYVVALPVAIAPHRSPVCLYNFFETKLGMGSIVQELRPKNLLCFEGSQFYGSLMATLGKQLRVGTFCIQWGVFYPIWRDVAFANMEFDYFVSWGEYFSKDLQRANPKLKFIENYEFQFSACKTERDSVIFLDQRPGELISEKDHHSFVKMAVNFKSKNPECRVTYRLHQSSHGEFKFKDYLIKSGVSVDENIEPLAYELEKCWAAVSIYSSGLVEALASGAIPVVINTTCFDNFPIQLAQNNVGFEFNTFCQATQKLMDLSFNKAMQLQYQDNIRKFSQELFTKNGSLAALLNSQKRRPDL